MNISSVNSYQQNSMNFKSVYPVYHWVAEKGGKYAPVISEELNGKLQRDLVRYINRSGAKPKNEPTLVKKIFDYLLKSDKGFLGENNNRTFYSENGGIKDGKVLPFQYLFTGKDVDKFTEALGKPIGRAIRATKQAGLSKTAEVDVTKGNYWKQGLSYAKSRAKEFMSRDGVQYALHTKYEVVRGPKSGKPKYKLVDIKFCPENSPESPIEKYIARNGLEK